MRRFIRHPTSVPIECQATDEHVEQETQESHAQHDPGGETLIDVSEGGVSFSTGEELAAGGKVHLTIRVREQDLEVDGVVMWCRPTADGFDIGVAFDDPATVFAVRMVEQVCLIEKYRAMVKAKEGRELSSQAAAEEWIERYAADFPD